MRTIDELIDVDEPAFPLIREWAAAAVRPVDFLPPSAARRDALDWEPLQMGYSDFLQWAFSGELAQFYDWIRWPGWEDDVKTLHGDRSSTDAEDPVTRRAD